MSRKQPIKALIIGPNRIASFKIGIEQPFSYLRQTGICDYLAMDEDKVGKHHIADADIVIIVRSCKPKAYQCLRWANAMQKRTVYMIDDHFLAMPSSTQTGKNFQAANHRKIFTQLLKHAQYVKVASPFFAKHLKKHYAPKRIVCFPGSVNFSLIDQAIYKRSHHKRLIIGYAGGKKEHAFQPVIRALKRVVRKYGDRVELQFFGYIPPELLKVPNVRHIPFDSDYTNYLKQLYRMEWDIGLAPLDRALYHDCKTDNKFREYATCEIAGIYSRTPTYSDSVSDGETGLLVGPSHEDWYQAIKMLIEHPELRRRIKREGKQIARKRYTIRKCAMSWKNKILHDL